VGRKKWIKRWLLRVAIASFSAAVILFPTPEPTVVTAKPIILDGRESVYALAYIVEDVPFLPAQLMGSGWLSKPEHLIADLIKFEDPGMIDAKVSAWTAAKFIDGYGIPEDQVGHRGKGQGEELNITACGLTSEETNFGCLSEKPSNLSSLLLSILDSLQKNNPNSSSLGGHESRSTIENSQPAGEAGGLEQPISPSGSGDGASALDENLAPLPQERGLGLWVGRSVGLAYYLAYLDHLGGPLIPEGIRVAATGMITTSSTGSARVHRIYGLEEKALGALREGVNVIFVPYGQAQEIDDIENMTVVEVDYPFEAVRWLCQQGSTSKYCYP